MGNYIQTLGEQMGTQGANGILGMIMGGINDRRQQNQQEALQGIQIRGNKEMMDYNFQKQLEMWQNTNYQAQVEQMKKAGINPALLYGMSGGGGTTTGGGGQSVQGASAPTGGREIQDMMGMGIQFQIMKAQKENIEADTKAKLAGLPNIELTGENIQADTGLKRGQTMNLIAGLDNIRQETAMKEVQTHLLKIEEYIKNETAEDAIRAIQWAAEKILQEMTQARFETNIKEGTWETKVLQATAELSAIYTRNALMNSEMQINQEQIVKISQEVTNMIQEIGQKWYNLSLETRRTLMQERLIKFNTAISQRTYDNILRGIQTVAGAIKPGTTINQAPRETNIYNQ